MKYVDEYRDPERVQAISASIASLVTRPWTIMEVCGGQTHAILRYGLDTLLPNDVNIVHGPGCPVCVTPVEIINQALEIASRADVIFCSFGDMLRVPGSGRDLLTVKASGGDVRIVYSPTDAVKIAQENSEKQVVFFAVGFETTAPANAMAVSMAAQAGLDNFSVLSAHVLVPPALGAVLSAPEAAIQGLLAAGHVCTVMGYEEYLPIASEHGVPIVVTGFEPVDILQGLFMCLKQLEEGRAEVENQYSRSVRREGNPHARKIMSDIFEVIPRKWRGIGEIPASGLGLRAEYSKYDAAQRFETSGMTAEEPAECICGLILQGRKRPPDCVAFGTTCTPEHPLGATMVSSEGACAAFYSYRKDPVVSD